MYKISINIKQDLKKFLLKIFEKNYLKEKYSIYANDDDLARIRNSEIDELLHLFFNLKSRLIKQQKYNVFMSEELINNPLYPNFKSRIRKISNKLKTNKDIRGYLSTGINNLLNSKDPLLQDWGVHHLHFEKCFYPRQRNRTNALIFVMVINNNIYFIDIYKHGDWFKKTSLEIVHRNWINALDYCKLNGITPDVLTEGQFKALRKNDVGYVIGFNGSKEAYSPSINPYSRMNIILKINKIMYSIEKIEEFTQQKSKNIIRQTNEELGINLSSLNIKFDIDEERKIVQYYDESIRTGFKLDDNIMQRLLIDYEII